MKFWAGLVVAALFTSASMGATAQDGATIADTILSLDGDGWQIAIDPDNTGREQEWFNGPVDAAKVTRVPWIIQDAFPGYHGIAWYWRTFDAPQNPFEGGRYILKFWAVDYYAEVWLNGQQIAKHEDGESPFWTDVTDVLRVGAPNMLAVRVLNPTDAPIDGIVLNETAHRNKVNNYYAGGSFNHGGITDSVDLIMAPPVRINDLYAVPDAATGDIALTVTALNATDRALAATLTITIAPASTGQALTVKEVEVAVAPGESLLRETLHVDAPHLWDLNDPYLYRVTARLAAQGVAQAHEASTRCGFRDFRFANGAFRLNGRRIFLKCSHTGNHYPLGMQLAHDPDLYRRDLVNVKAMGFNAIRFIAGVARREQLDLCDELGLLVYEEPYGAWCMADSPNLEARYDASMIGMLLRDRNHPSIVIWGLLNETGDGRLFRHAAGFLPRLREFDNSRMVLLNSGRWDLQGQAFPVTQQWHGPSGIDPNVNHNAGDAAVSGFGITWQPGQMAFHPGVNGEYSVVRWTAPRAGDCGVQAHFSSIAERATTDVHVLHNGAPLYDAGINVNGGGREATYEARITVNAGDTVDCAVGFGNGSYGADTTAIALNIALNGEAFDAAAEFSVDANPNGPWSYGVLAPGERPDVSTFTLYIVAVRPAAESSDIGSLANPGSLEWEDVLDDQHCYPRVPHTQSIVEALRTMRGTRNPVGVGEGGLPQRSSKNPLFISEYGIGSAVDLVRTTRHYEQLRATHFDDALFYRAQLDAFMGDWERWGMAGTFGRPEDYFTACLTKMADQRLLGLNALRSNPALVAHSMTGTIDQGMTGEGVTCTTFREPKPGTFDAVFDGFAPLRWCLFASPWHLYRGREVRLEAVLANEDALAPGPYSVTFCVFDGDSRLVFRRQKNVTIRPETENPPFAIPVFDETVAFDGPAGRYRFVASFDSGAAAGGEVFFQVADPAEMPAVEHEVAVVGLDEALAAQLAGFGIATRPFDAQAAQPEHEVILVGPDAGAVAAAHDAIAARVSAGATVIFLCPEAARSGDDATCLLPLDDRGGFKGIGGWLYLKDEWASRHSVFDGLPVGLMPYDYYGPLIPDLVWTSATPPAEVLAGANKTSQGYDSGILLAVQKQGTGRVIVNTLRIRENLGAHPAAERLLRNLVRYAAR